MIYHLSDADRSSISRLIDDLSIDHLSSISRLTVPLKGECSKGVVERVSKAGVATYDPEIFTGSLGEDK